MTDLVDKFRSRAAASEAMDPNVLKRSRFIMPHKLYETLHEIHKRSLIMARKILEVMDDEEHQFMMEYGRRKQMVLPDFEAVKADIMLYAAFLEEFAPEDVRFVELNGLEHVSVPAETALKMAHMLQYNNLVLETIEKNLKDTGYMAIFTDAKARGLIYSGKSALAEIMNLALTARLINTKNDRALKPETWPVAVYKEMEP